MTATHLPMPLTAFSSTDNRSVSFSPWPALTTGLKSASIRAVATADGAPACTRRGAGRQLSGEDEIEAAAELVFAEGWGLMGLKRPNDDGRSTPSVLTCFALT